MQTVGTVGLWISFFVIVAVVLGIDFYFLKRKKSHIMTMRKAGAWVTLWMMCALVFNLLLWLHLRHTIHPEIADQRSLEFLTGYIIEKSLSVDNMFAFLAIFSYFTIPAEYQRRVLIYGVLGAVILRFIVIISGVWLVNAFHWVLYLFGILLLITGLKMLFSREEKQDISKNILLNWLKKHLPVTHEFHGNQFFVKLNKYWYVTPMFLALVLIECSDLVFALDSIPAIFAITNDTFIIFTSNIFAILGLRALYFVLANLADRFHLLKYGIAVLLIFIGVKMLIEPWIKIPIFIALSAVVAILGTTILLSMKIKRI